MVQIKWSASSRDHLLGVRELRVLKASAAMVVAAALAAAVSLLVSCSDDGCTPKVDEPKRDTPAALLKSFSDAWEDQHIDAYTACLDQAYRFEFMEEDWESAGVTPDAPYWGKAQDVASTANMFESDKVVGLSFDWGLPLTAETCPDSVCRCLYQPDIQVVVEKPGKGRVTYWVNASWLHVTLARDPQDHSLWVIRKMREEEAGALGDRRSLVGRSPSGTDEGSFGKIKIIFK
jgi:hypothetical protein